MIHPSAIVDPKSSIAPNVEIGPGAVIGANVEIDEGTWIGPYAVIQGPTQIGKDNKIFQFTSIGESPQDKRYKGEDTKLVIGDRNIFRECATVHRGTTSGKGITQIGSDNFFMAYTHVAHDCVIGNHVIFSNNASIAGHVSVGDYACLGGMVGVHQFCAIGAYSFIGGGSIIYKDVLPFVMVSGFPAEPYGLNTVGLERQGFQPAIISALKAAYKIIFRQSLTLKEALIELQKMGQDVPEIILLTNFINESKRGIAR